MTVKKKKKKKKKKKRTKVKRGSYSYRPGEENEEWEDFREQEQGERNKKSNGHLD